MRHIPLIFTKETCEKMKEMDHDERRAKLAGVITAFFQGKHPAICGVGGDLAISIATEMGVDKELVGKMLAILGTKGMTGPSDAPNGMNRNLVTAGVFHPAMGDASADFGFEDLFDFVDMRTAGQTSFDILDVTNAITFTEKKSGSKMKVYGISDGKSTVEKMTIAAAIGIEDDWINYYQFWNLNKAIIEAMAKYYSKMATDHYALIAAGTNGQAFDTDDITTINNACAAILDDCEGKGYNLTGNEVFEVRANILLKQRVEKAFAMTFNSAGDPKQLVHTCNRKYSTKLSASYIYVVLPGRKLMRGIWSDLKAETDRDILLQGTDVAYSGEYNAAIGEVLQVKRCSLS